MEQAIERLRQSKQTFIQKQAGDGHKYGTDWATLRATYEQLKHLSSLDR